MKTSLRKGRDDPPRIIIHPGVPLGELFPADLAGNLVNIAHHHLLHALPLQAFPSRRRLTSSAYEDSLWVSVGEHGGVDLESSRFRVHDLFEPSVPGHWEIGSRVDPAQHFGVMWCSVEG